MVRVSRLEVPLTWYPWPPSEWMSDRHFQRLSWAEKGLARELLDECYLGRTIPADVEALAERLAVEASEIRDLLPRVMRWFTPSGEGVLSCPWIEAVRASQDQVRLRQAQRRLKGADEDDITAVNRGSRVQEITEEKNREEESERNACAESDAPTPARGGTPLFLPCRGKSAPVWEIPNGVWRQWEQAFPGLDLLTEVLKMRAWLNANPHRQKTHGGMERFAYSWLARAKEPGQGSGISRVCDTKPPSRTPGLDKDFLDQLGRSEEEGGGDDAS